MCGTLVNIMIFDTKSQRYYHPAPMSGQALNDALKFAREGDRLDGEIPVVSMTRLHDIVAQAAGFIRYRMQGGGDSNRRPVIDISVEGQLQLVCQRCLEPISYPLKRTSRFVLVSESGEWPDVADEDPDTEAISVDAFAVIEDVVEQEVLLGLQIAPMHADGGACGRDPKETRNDRPSPFAVLEKLKPNS